ncbi:MAG: nucleotidyltransferase domain-containing protein [Candidatus Aminicenantes bacterium]
MARRHSLQIIYAFGSRSKEVLEVIQGNKERLSSSKSDLDIGVKPEHPLNIDDKVQIACFFEDLLNLPRVDVVEIPTAPVSLALDIVQGELLYAEDSTFEAEYQLYIMKRAAELAPFEKMKKRMILGD